MYDTNSSWDPIGGGSLGKLNELPIVFCPVVSSTSIQNQLSYKTEKEDVSYVVIFLSKIDRYAVSKEALETYDTMLHAFTNYLCQFGDITIPFRAKKRYLGVK